MDALETHEHKMYGDIDKMSEEELKKLVKGLRGHAKALTDAIQGKRELEDEHFREQELRRKVEVAEEEVRQLRRQMEEDKAKNGKTDMDGSGGSASKPLKEMKAAKKENANLKQMVGDLQLKKLELKEELKQRTLELEAMRGTVKREGSKEAERLQESCGSEAEGGEQPGGELANEGDDLEEGNAEIGDNPTTIQSVKSEMIEEEEDELEDSESQHGGGQQAGGIPVDLAAGDDREDDKNVQEPEKGSGEDDGGSGEEEEDFEDVEDDTSETDEYADEEDIDKDELNLRKNGRSRSAPGTGSLKQSSPERPQQPRRSCRRQVVARRQVAARRESEPRPHQNKRMRMQSSPRSNDDVKPATRSSKRISMSTKPKHDSSEEDEGYHCRDCAAIFQTFNDLCGHWHTVHNTTKTMGTSRERQDSEVSSTADSVAQESEHGYPPGFNANRKVSKYPCKCGLSFANKYSLDRHLNTVESRNIFRCPFFCTTFSTVYNLNRHVRRTHKLTNFKCFGCRKCGTLFKHQKALDEHSTNAH